MMRTSANWSGFLSGSAVRRMESSNWKIAVLAPMPSAKVSHCDTRETGVIAQHAQGVADILKQSGHNVFQWH